MGAVEHDEDLLRVLRETRSVAVVGASPDPSRASHQVAAYLLDRTPFRVHLVNPHAREILGRPVHARLADLPEVPDLVDVFRRLDDVPGVLDEVLAVGASTLWLQLGLRDEDVARRGTEGGLTVVMDRCLKVDHARLSARL